MEDQGNTPAATAETLREPETERDALKAIADEAYPGIAHDFEQCRIERDALKVKCKRLRAALEFYADEWEVDTDHPGAHNEVPGETYSITYSPTDALCNDHGRIAIAVLTPPEQEKQT